VCCAGGTLSIKVTAADIAMTSVSTNFSLNILPTGIEEHQAIVLTVFPNPIFGCDLYKNQQSKKKHPGKDL